MSDDLFPVAKKKKPSLGVAIVGGTTDPRERGDRDYYRTPPAAIEALLEYWTPPYEEVWEPACGDGSLAEVIQTYGYPVIATEIEDRGYGETGIDFLQTTEKRSNLIITNPPFSLAAEFITHARDLGVQRLALLLKTTYWQAAVRKQLFRDYPPAMVLALTWRLDFKDLKAPTMDCVWCVWEPGDPRTIYDILPKPTVSAERLAIFQNGFQDGEEQ